MEVTLKSRRFYGSWIVVFTLIAMVVCAVAPDVYQWRLAKTGQEEVLAQVMVVALVWLGFANAGAALGFIKDVLDGKARA